MLPKSKFRPGTRDHKKNIQLLGKQYGLAKGQLIYKQTLFGRQTGIKRKADLLTRVAAVQMFIKKKGDKRRMMLDLRRNILLFYILAMK